jgi:hypothetical protein
MRAPDGWRFLIFIPCRVPMPIRIAPTACMRIASQRKDSPQEMFAAQRGLVPIALVLLAERRTPGSASGAPSMAAGSTNPGRTAG